MLVNYIENIYKILKKELHIYELPFLYILYSLVISKITDGFHDRIYRSF